MKVMVIAALFLPSTTIAGWYPGDSSHNPQDEQFSFQDMSQSSHMFAGAAIAVVGQQLLVKTGMKPIPAALTAMAFSALVGAAKETFVDDYCSPSGIKSFWFGAAIGGVTMITLSF